MKKIFFLSALLCASMMAWAAAPVTGSSTEKSDGNDFINGYDYSFSTEGTTVTISFTEKENFTGLVAYLWEYNPSFKETQMTVNGHTASISLTNQTAGTELRFACKFAFAAGGSFPNGMCVTKQFTYTVPEPDKSDPGLTLNETSVTLDASIPGTFTILPERNGDGAISYLSNNTDIATVTNGGVVTAVAKGTTTITVSVASTDDYYSANTELTVTVTGVNWNAIGWLSGSDNKYKLCITPNFGDQFGGKRIEGTNLWVGFPSAAFGACSIPYEPSGAAWQVFALSNFPNQYNQFTIECGGTLYTFDIYYAGSTTAIDNVETSEKARKVLENGQLIIIKNGVRYNALGAQMK